jgi:anaphase-promoting complex subunit 1
MTMAGSGDLDCFKQIIRMYASIEKEASYGCHMAFHMALGMLFLGRGTCSLGNSDLSIASLFCTFYPLYPSTTIDNRCHLQALRHFWVLAVESRCLVTKDVNSGQIVRVPIEVITKSTKINAFSPCILPHFDQIMNIKVTGPRYWNLDVPADKIIRTFSFSSNTVWVQRKLQHLSYADDPDGRLGLLATSFPTSSIAGESDMTRLLEMRDQFIQSYSSSPQISSFVKYLCHPNRKDESSLAFSLFCTTILYECLSQDKLEMIPIYIWIYHAVHRFIETDTRNGLICKSLSCIIEFAKQIRINHPEVRSIIDTNYINLIMQRLNSFFDGIESHVFKGKYLIQNTLLQYLKQGSLPKLESQERALVTSYLKFYQWPLTNDIEPICSFMLKAKQDKMPAKVVSVLLKNQFKSIPIRTITKMISLLEYNS